MTKKIIRIPKDDERNIMVIHEWIWERKIHLKCEVLYRHLPWDDGKWHTGPKEEIAAVDFENKDDAYAFAIWLGLGIE